MINRYVLSQVLAATDIALDILILLLPLPVIKNLNMGRGQKLSVIGLLWLGLL